MISESESEVNQKLADYSKSIQTICMVLVISVLLIVVFMVSPLKKYGWISFAGKVLCIGLLIYVLYQNMLITKTFANISANGDTKSSKMYNYILSLFIIILILSILRKMFLSQSSSPSESQIV